MMMMMMMMMMMVVAVAVAFAQPNWQSICRQLKLGERAPESMGAHER
ncbi:MAG: hypothetical protein N6V49_14840 [Serratia symbiotica]|nr:hypothetical protein [Serratia symbiotica]